MRTKDRIITTGALAVLTLLGGALGSASAQCYQQLWAPDGQTDERFGNSVAAQDDVVAISASHHEDDAGAVYVYRQQGNQWVLEAKLQPRDKDPDGRLSFPSIYGDVLLMGSGPSDTGGLQGSGAAYVFRWDGAKWEEEAKLVPSDPGAGDAFGAYATAAGADVLAVGAWRDDAVGEDSGSVYVFRMVAGTWVEEAKLIPSVGNGQQGFGNGVALVEDRVFVGAPQWSGGAGSVYVFRYEAGAWIEEARLQASDGGSGNGFGCQLSVDGDRLLVGARYANAAYMFSWNGTSWVEEAKLTPSDSGGWYGMAVALRGDRLAVGAIFNQSSGSTYLYRWDGSRWNEVSKLHHSNLPGGSRFGHWIAMQDDYFVVGAPMRGGSDIGVGPGTAYIYGTCEWTWENFADGWPGTLGIPELTADTTLPPMLTIDIDNSFGPPTVGFLFAGLSKAAIETPWGGELCVLPAAPVWPFLLPIQGLTLTAAVPGEFADELFLQVLELDLGASQGVSFTRGLHIQF